MKLPSSNGGRAAPEGMLISLFEGVIYALDLFSVVPVWSRLAETEDGGITGDMDIVPAEVVEVIGPVPRLSTRLRPVAW